jgi:hypothetical protein
MAARGNNITAHWDVPLCFHSFLFFFFASSFLYYSDDGRQQQQHTWSILIISAGVR